MSTLSRKRQRPVFLSVPKRVKTTPWLQRIAPQKPTAFLINWANSCYLDALMTILFVGGQTSFYVDTLLNEPPLPRQPSKKGIRLCYGSSKIQTRSDEQRYARRLQNALQATFRNIMSTTKKGIKCIDLREVLRVCQTDIFRKSYVMYHAADIYTLLTSFFSALSYPSLNDPHIRFGTMSLVDYMNKSTPQKPLPATLLAKDVPVLVYRNTETDRRLTNAIRHFGRPRQIGKSWLTEFIHGGKYRLFGVVMHEGGGNDGGHYVSYMRPYFDANTWYKYDDQEGLNPFKRLQRLPASIFKVTRNTMPEMYFYERILTQKDLDKIFPLRDAPILIESSSSEESIDKDDDNNDQSPPSLQDMTIIH